MVRTKQEVTTQGRIRNYSDRIREKPRESLKLGQPLEESRVESLKNTGRFGMLKLAKETERPFKKRVGSVSPFEGSLRKALHVVEHFLRESSNGETFEA